MRPTRSLTLGTAVLVTAAATWSLAQTGGAVAAPADQTALRSFFTHDTSLERIDLGKKGAGHGDLLTFHGNVFKTKGGTILFNGKKFDFGIVGGTGAYSNAKGEGTQRIDVKDKTNAFVTLNVK